MGETVRRLRPAEWPLWRELRLRALADAPDAFGETLAEARARDEAGWRDFAARPDIVQLIAERGGAPVGMTLAVIEAIDPARAHLNAMWVAPEARGGGLGGALLEAALRWSRGRAALELVLGVAEDNGPARALYERRGFRDTGEQRMLRDGAEIAIRVMALRQLPLVMGVVNVTPDSFSDGGRYLDPAAAIDHGLALAADGADLLDVGGEATNPRAAPIDAREELRRVLPVIEALVAAGATVSIDTTKAEVARAAVAAGAAIVNDVSGGLFDPAMAEVLADLDATYIAGHLRGASLAAVFAPEQAGAPPSWPEVAVELGQRLAALPPAVRARAWVDPGVGFGKGADPESNLGLLRRAGELRLAVRRPVVVGPSRKRFLRRLLDGERGAVAAAAAGAAARGAAASSGATAQGAVTTGAAASGAAVSDVTAPGLAVSGVTAQDAVMQSATGRGVTASGVTAPDVMALDAATVGACLGAVRGGAQVLRVHNVALLRAALAVYTKI